MISAFLTLCAAASLGAEPVRNAPLLRLGPDGSQGLLTNRTVGARPFDPPDPSRATLVFVHGFNPVPRTVHFTMADRVAEAVGRRAGSAFNVLSWDWNAATYVGLSSRANAANSTHQGHALAASLRRAGIDPSRTHLVGHSAGGIVAASAARVLSRQSGRPVAQLTLLEPAGYYHDVIFDQQTACASARVVENYWVPGPSAFGREAPFAGVRNYRIACRAPVVGVVWPLRSDHLGVVHWYLGTIEDPRVSSGFNTCLLLTGSP